MHWFILSLLSALSLASADAATKYWLSGYRARELLLVRFVFSALFLAPIVLLQPWPHLPVEFWYWVAALVPLEVAAMLLYMRAIRDHPLAHTVPYLAFTPVITTLTGYLLLGETVSAAGFTGILLVVCGAWLLNAERVRGEQGLSWLAPFRAILTEKGSQLMLVVAVIYSLTSVMGKGAMQYTTPWFFGAFYFCLLGLVVFVLYLPAGGGPGALRRRMMPHLLVGFLMAAMVVTHFLAIQKTEVAYMIAVKRTSLLFAIGYGALLFGEKRVWRHLLAGSIMLAGVILIGVQNARAASAGVQ
jgi:drug/metabolite transporter (DMT)-like permease